MQGLELFEPTAYHNQPAPGYFSIHNVIDRKRFPSDFYELPFMPKVISLIDPNYDTYISQGEFWKRSRRVVNLARIGLSFVDLDTYNIPALKHDPIEAIIFKILGYCDSEGIPKPSLILYSGRGYQLKWLFTAAIPRTALPRWNLLQKTFIDKLIDLGADPVARDAARILRLDQTLNTKSGNRVELVYVAGSDNDLLRYDFDFLCDSLFPLTRVELQEKREARKEYQTNKIAQPRKTSVFFSGKALAWSRLEDIRFLYQLRGGVPEGERMNNLFWRLNFLLLSRITNSRDMWFEAHALAREISPTWNYEKAELSTLYSKAKAYERGERIEYNGKKYLPFYTPRNSTLLSLFHITSAEEKKLTTIISKEEHNLRRTEKRRVQGRIPRMEYEKYSHLDIKPWESLGITRESWYMRRLRGVRNRLHHLSSITDCNKK